MLKMNVLPADTYVVTSESIISEQDHKIIIKLYQPIIGAKTTSLYFTLRSYLDQNISLKDIYTHHHLITSMNLKLNEIIEAREKLEAIGLLKTYVKKGNINHFIYEIYAPLSPAEFINNPILTTSLYNNIGEKEYEKMINYFKIHKIDKKEYEDITVLFSDVFDIKAKEIEPREEFKNRKSRNINIISKIDLDEIISMLPEEYLNRRSITQNTRDLLYKLAYIYHLDDDDLLEIIRNSVTEKCTLDNDKLRGQARKLYEFEHKGALPNLIYKNQPAYLKKETQDISKRSKIIYTFENTSPHAFLKSKYKGGKVPVSEVKLLEYLAVDLDLKPGVINVVIDYILRINNSKLTKNFVITVAAQFKKAGIETVEDAMKLAEKEYKNRKTSVKKEKKIVQKPEWFDKKIEKKEANEEEKEELSKLLEEFR